MSTKAFNISLCVGSSISQAWRDASVKPPLFIYLFLNCINVPASKYSESIRQFVNELEWVICLKALHWVLICSRGSEDLFLTFLYTLFMCGYSQVFYWLPKWTIHLLIVIYSSTASGCKNMYVSIHCRVCQCNLHVIIQPFT